MSSTVCRMKETLGQIEPCPERECPFWDTRGVGPEGRCAFVQLDLGGRPELAAFLLGVRSELEAAAMAEDANDARRLSRMGRDGRLVRGRADQPRNDRDPGTTTEAGKPKRDQTRGIGSDAAQGSGLDALKTEVEAGQGARVRRLQIRYAQYDQIGHKGHER